MNNMNQAISILSASLHYNSIVINSVADNVANLNTTEYKQETNQTPNNVLYKPISVPMVIATSSAIDLAENLMRLKQSEISYKMSAKLIASIDQTQKNVIDSIT